MDDVAYYHPYPSNPKPLNVWNYFRCKRGVEYSQHGHSVYCMECSSQQIDGDKTKAIFFTTKWYLGGPTTELKRHVDKKHCDESQTATMSPAGLHTPKLTTLATAEWSKDRCRKFARKLVYDLCIRDKESINTNSCLFWRRGKTHCNFGVDATCLVQR